VRKIRDGGGQATRKGMEGKVRIFGEIRRVEREEGEQVMNIINVISIKSIVINDLFKKLIRISIKF
jgi:hypothetical protein